jgi:hypothetical protein
MPVIEIIMTMRRGKAVLTVPILLLALAGGAACGGDDDDDDSAERRLKLAEGTFVGKARGTDAFVAVVASPAPTGKRRRDATVFVCDARTICDWLAGSTSGNAFSVASDGDDAKGKGNLTAKAARGSIQVGGKTLNFVASRAAATAGLYALKVSPKGRFTGASAAGVGLTGRSMLPEPGPGTLKLADGTRLKFNASENSADDRIRLPAGEARVIILPGRQLRGAGNAPAGEGGASPFFMRSPR